MSKKNKIAPKPDTVITLTLPGEGGIERTGSLIIKRGDLALLSQFNYSNLGDIAASIGKATEGLVDLASTSLPVIKTTDADVYKPDLEAKRKKLVEGTSVWVKDGKKGEIISQPALNEYDVPFAPDCLLASIDDEEGLIGAFPIAGITIIPQVKPSNEPTVDPLTVKPEVVITARPATDVSPVGEAPAQLTMF